MRRLTQVPAAIVVLALLAACGGPTAAPPAPGGVGLFALPTPDPSARTELPLGVQVFESDVTTPALEHLRGAGVAWARTRALWKLIEPVERASPAYDWSVTDWLFGDVHAAGFRNIAAVYANPPWAAAIECGPVRPVKLERYGAFWTALVERYDGDGVDDAPGGPVVAYWQVSNEADFDLTVPSDEGDYGGCFGHDPAAYAEHLVVAARAARAADPGVRMVFGPVAWDRFTAETAPAGWPAAPGPFAYDFTARALEHLYAAYADDPGLPFFDAVSLHNYNDNAHFWDGPSGRELVGKVAAFRAEQLTMPGVYDLRSLPVIVSETGLATAPSDEFTERSEALQAAYVGQTMVRALAADVTAAIWYTARDNLWGDCAPPHYEWLSFGLMRAREYADALARCPDQDWMPAYPLDSAATPRPALTALTTLNRALGLAGFVRQLTPGELGHDDVEAYQFAAPGGRAVVAAWTTTGERLGKRGVEPITGSVALTADHVVPWTGRLEVTEHLGDVATVGEAGLDVIMVPVGPAPVYLRAAP